MHRQHGAVHPSLLVLVAWVLHQVVPLPAQQARPRLRLRLRLGPQPNPLLHLHLHVHLSIGFCTCLCSGRLPVLLQMPLQGRAGDWEAAATPAGGTAAGDSQGEEDEDADLAAVPWSTKSKAVEAPAAQQQQPPVAAQPVFRRLHRPDGAGGSRAGSGCAHQHVAGAAEMRGAGGLSGAEEACEAAGPLSPSTGQHPASYAPLAAGAGAAEGAAGVGAAKPKGNPFARTGTAAKCSVSPDPLGLVWGGVGREVHMAVTRKGTEQVRGKGSACCSALHFLSSWCLCDRLRAEPERVVQNVSACVSGVHFAPMSLARAQTCLPACLLRPSPRLAACSA